MFTTGYFPAGYFPAGYFGEPAPGVHADVFAYTMSVKVTNRLVPPSSPLAALMDTDDRVHVGDSGVPIIVSVEDDSGRVDLSTADSLQILFQKNDLSMLTAGASFLTDGTDGLLIYRFLPGDLDQTGTWRLQARLAFGDEIKYSNVIKFKVYGNLPLGA